MSDRTPFYNFGQPAPYAFPAPAAPTYHHAAQPQARPVEEPGWVEMYCDMCEGRIDAGEETIEFFVGVAGRSQQTGYLTTIPDPSYTGADVTTVHKKCAIEHVLNNLCQEQADDILAEQVMEMAGELFEEWQQRELLERRLADPGA